MNCASLFARESANLLCETYLPRLRLVLAELRPVDLWWRPHAGCTSVANLLLHLEGNVRQWILSGLGGVEDQRQREGEFSAREAAPLSILLERLERTVRTAAELIAHLPESRLCERSTIQGFDTTVLGAVYHVVEHFSWHVGQITWIVKERAGSAHGIALYDDAAINTARNPSAEIPR